MDNRDSEVKLSILCPSQGSIEFGPLRPGIGKVSAYDFLIGPITVVDAGNSTETLNGRNGIEALALAHLRDDLRQLSQRGHGVVFFGDHDFAQIVELEVVRGAVVRVVANLASLDRFDIPVGEVSIEALDGIIAQIDLIESAFGPLLGYCGGCGMPTTAYFPKPLV